MSNVDNENLLPPEYLIVMTLQFEINNSELTEEVFNSSYYNKVWYQKAVDWSELESSKEYFTTASAQMSTQYFRVDNSNVMFSMSFPSEPARDDFCDRNYLEELRESLSSAGFTITGYYTLDRKSGHKGIGR